MTEQTSTTTVPRQGRVRLDFTREQAEDILGDLPGGQGVSEATRDLYRRLHQARRAPRSAMPGDTDDILYAPIQPVRDLPEKEPRTGYVIRERDTTGTLGLGIIAEFAIFSDGATAIRLPGGPPHHQARWEIYDNPGIEPFEQLSQYTGPVKIVWLGSEEPDE